MNVTAKDDTGTFLAPALLTGTSGEFLGRKPLPRLLRQRHLVFVLGPEGVGKSTVARALCGQGWVELDKRQLEHVVLQRVHRNRWPDGLVEAPSLVIDGPVWLRQRPGTVQFLLELAQLRGEHAHRTVFCQAERDGSIEELISRTEPGKAVVVGLRFPTGRKSRLRVARQMCDSLAIPREVATGSEVLEPWRYDRLVAFMVERARPSDGGGTGG